MGFDYKWTCPQIDKNIQTAKNEIDSFLDSFLEDALPLLPLNIRRDIVEQKTSELYGLLEPIFEETRDTNEDMRNEASKQIDMLEEELQDAKEEIIRLENEL